MNEKDNKLIVKHNKLIEAKYKLSLQEQKMILILASRINKEDENFNKQVFSIKELANFLGLKKDWYYSEMKFITKSLINKVIQIKKDNKFLQVSFLEYAEYIENEGIVELQFSSKLKPYFLQLKNNFTKYYLKNVIKFDSIYSIRIYELLKQYEKLKKRKFKIEELKEILGIKDKYSRYYDFKKRVIFQSQKEINKKTNFKIDFEEIKTGRKVTAIKFLIKKKEEIAKQKENIDPKEIKDNISFNEEKYSDAVLRLFRFLPEQEKIEQNKETLSKLLQNHSFEYLKADIEYAKEKKPNNFVAFLISSCKEGHYSSADLEKKKRKEELERKKRKKRERKENLKNKIEEKAKKKALEKYENSSKENLKKYIDEYNNLPDFVKKNKTMPKKAYIIATMQEEIQKKLEELSEVIF